MNFEAFAKLYGYISFFHPNDEASEIDWDKFAIYGMKCVESASNINELQNILNELFHPLAPSLKLHIGEKYEYDKSSIIPHDISHLKQVAWQHKGVYQSERAFGYKSVRINREKNPTPGAGKIGSFYSAEEFRGKNIKLSGAVKMDVNGSGNQGQLWLSVEKKDVETGFFDDMIDRPITSDTWNEYEITCKVDDDAEMIRFGCLLKGKGKLWIDELRLYVQQSDGSWKDLEFENSDFEMGEEGDGLDVWGYSYGEYMMTITAKDKYKGSKCGLIEYRGDDNLADRIFEWLPKPGELVTKKLTNDLYCTFPVSLYSNDNGTIPMAPVDDFYSLTGKMNSFTSEHTDANSKYLRLAGIAIAWNVLQHFYPYFEVSKIDWAPVLPQFLKYAFDAKDEMEFYDVLKKMGTVLKDGHTGIRLDKVKTSYFPEIIMDRVEGKIVVCRVLDNELKDIVYGDEVLTIDGIDINEAISDKLKYISGSTFGHREFIAITRSMPGAKTKTDVKFRIRDKEGTEKDIVLKRTKDFMEMYNAGWKQEERPNDITEIKKGIMYVNLDKASMDDINKSMDKLEKAKGIIFDVRGYPKGNHDIIGHLIDEPVLSAKWNIPRSIYPDRIGNPPYDTSGRWLMPPIQPRLNAEVVFLTNAEAISYAESVMGIIEGYKIADIIGSPTAGTNGNVNYVHLPGGFSMSWTGMLVLKHDDTVHQGVGVLPTIPVSKTIKGVAQGRDEVLEKAIEVLESRI